MLAKCNDMAVSLCHLVEQTKTVTMGSHCVLAWEVLRGAHEYDGIVNSLLTCVPAQSKN